MSPRPESSTELSSLGRALLAWMEREGLTQAVTAKLIGTKQRTLSDWMRQDTLPDAVHALVKLGALMGTNIEELLDCETDLFPLRDTAIVREMVRSLASPTVFQRYQAARENRATDSTVSQPEKEPASKRMKIDGGPNE